MRITNLDAKQSSCLNAYHHSTLCVSLHFNKITEDSEMFCKLAPVYRSLKFLVIFALLYVPGYRFNFLGVCLCFSPKVTDFGVLKIRKI